MIYEVNIKVTGAQPPRGEAIIGLTYIVRAENEINAKIEALNRARRAQAEHPRRYKNATFSVEPDGVKIFN